MNPIFLAQYLVNRFGHVPGGITPLKLQKLLYYVKAWSLVEGRDLVDGGFERWDYGPVHPGVYRFYKSWGRTPIQPKQLSPQHAPSGAEKRFVDFVGTSYAYIPAIELSALTHRESPWRQTSPNATIDEGLMVDYYSQHPFARNLPFDPVNKPYFPVEAGLHRSFVMDMSTHDAERATRYPSFAAYMEHLTRLEQQGMISSEAWLSRLMA